MTGVAAIAPLTGPGLWTRDSFGPLSACFFKPDSAATAELQGALQASEGKNLDAIRPRQEELPQLGRMARSLRELILRGSGFAVFDDPALRDCSAEEMKRAYWILSCLLGSPLRQNLKGERMCTVADLGYDPADPNIRNSMTNREIGYHTDTVVFGMIDIVGLLCVVQAPSGGESLLISTAAVYNRLLAEAPKSLSCLARSFPIDRRAEHAAGMDQVSMLPVLRRDGEEARMQYNYKLMVSGLAKIERRLEPEEEEALSHLNAILARPELAVSFRMEPGQMLFCSNDRTLHDRASWQDPPGAPRRHLERMWIELSPSEKAVSAAP